MVTFDHRDPGTPEDEWSRHESWASVPWILPVGTGKVLVIAAHPDDETLGAGGLLSRLHRAGVDITIMLVTRGDAAPGADGTPLRWMEFLAAVTRLAPSSTIVDLGLPDRELSKHMPELTSSIELASDGADLIVAPWRGDGHGDHRVAGEVAAAVAGSQGIALLEYPIWFWHWAESTSAAAPWDSFVRVLLTPDDRRAKQAALSAYSSQLDYHDGEPPMLHDGMLEHFGRGWETFVRGTP